MTCIKCQHGRAKKFGTYGKRRIQRYRCTSCRATFAEPHSLTLGRHYMPPEKAAQIVAMMLEGTSVRSISRLTDVDKNTILSLLLSAGEQCRRVLDRYVTAIRPRFVQMDELWTYVGCHGSRLGKDAPAEWGDQWVWLALDSESKLIISHHIGARNSINAYRFVHDLAARTVGRYQITTDALSGYLGAIEEWFGADVDYAQLVKVYGRLEPGPDWYGSGRVIAAVPRVRTGNPDVRRISTSHIERANLSVRTHLRRFTRMSLGYSKKLQNLKAAVTLFVAYYDMCRVHQSLRVTPAMQAGLTDHVWTVQELLAM